MSDRMRSLLRQEVGGFTVEWSGDRKVLIGWTDHESFVRTIDALSELLHFMVDEEAGSPAVERRQGSPNAGDKLGTQPPDSRSASRPSGPGGGR